mmetsp:Transcript_22382/g.25724  ORF Transcript_22382/g.25724 Transcript_22382/m.25724 type:complete len:88 (-) Transcript_22382:13-276(-)
MLLTSKLSLTSLEVSDTLIGVGSLGIGFTIRRDDFDKYDKCDSDESGDCITAGAFGGFECFEGLDDLGEAFKFSVLSGRAISCNLVF